MSFWSSSSSLAIDAEATLLRWRLRCGSQPFGDKISEMFQWLSVSFWSFGRFFAVVAETTSVSVPIFPLVIIAFPLVIIMVCQLYAFFFFVLTKSFPSLKHLEWNSILFIPLLPKKPLHVALGGIEKETHNISRLRALSFLQFNL